MKTKDFTEITKEIITAGEQYDDNIKGIFKDTLLTFITIVEELQNADTGIDSTAVKIKILDSIFQTDINKELIGLLKEAVLKEMNSENTQGDGNSENADEALLRSIRENIEEYTKD